MASIQYCNDELIIGVNRKIVFINPQELNVSKEITLPFKLTTTGTISEGILHEGGGSDEEKSDKSQKEYISPRFRQLAVSPNNGYVAITTSDKKALLLYKLNGNKVDLLSARNIARVSSALTFSGDSSQVLVCDKSGDCYLFDCLNFEQPGKWLLGHLSIVFDVIFTPQKDFIITCDRDEKIRVTKYPETHEIECYCLGHREYVSSIKLFPGKWDTLLLSLSGDSTIKVWNYKCGLKVYEIPLPAAGIKMCVEELNENECQLIVLVFRENDNILVYKLSNLEDKFECTLVSKYDSKSGTVSDLCVNKGRIFLSMMHENRLHLDVINSDLEKSAKLKTLVADLLKDEEFVQAEDISTWFKKKFDNISEYMERKSMRIEEKNSSR